MNFIKSRRANTGLPEKRRWKGKMYSSKFATLSSDIVGTMHKYAAFPGSLQLQLTYSRHPIQS